LAVTERTHVGLRENLGANRPSSGIPGAIRFKRYAEFLCEGCLREAKRLATLPNGQRREGRSGLELRHGDDSAMHGS
jgi:hypothetical protein